MSTLMIAYSERPRQSSEEDFNDWYDNQHIPRLLSLPGFTTSQRYIQADSLRPTYCTFYDLTTPDGNSIFHTPEFINHLATRSKLETTMMSTAPILNVRMYTPVLEQPASIRGPAARYILITDVDPIDRSLAFDQELNDWYNTVHIPNIMKTKGWVSTRRFHLQGNEEIGADVVPLAHAGRYLAIHEFNNDSYMKDTAMVAATDGGKTQKMASKLKVELRHFFLHEEFHQ